MTITIERDPQFPRQVVKRGGQRVGFLRMSRHGPKPATWEAQSMTNCGTRDFGTNKQEAIEWLIKISLVYPIIEVKEKDGIVTEITITSTPPCLR